MKYNVIVIGGGVVGLASAYRILVQQPGTKLCILEKEAAIALHQTGNNSGVIHSGIYYKPGSLKAINCKTGYSQLLQFAAEHSIPHDICGKIIVATNKSELQALDNIYHRGLANDLKGIYKMNPDEVKEREPHVKAEAAIWVPQTGIIDYKEFSARLLQLIQHQGGEIFLNNKVEKIENDQSSFKITTSRAVYITSFVINCAGLYSDHI
ncbi:MAG TPA: FAD-dependent oxidoreductase, partial [Saprospiraceae bacterium]|nr:FAD-dependent oxidoreductase [Saprospiraceae bacterium]